MWKLVGYDAFSSEWYPYREFGEGFKTEAEARKAGQGKLAALAISQPGATQDTHGIQDRVFIESPDGRRIRLMPD